MKDMTHEEVINEIARHLAGSDTRVLQDIASQVFDNPVRFTTKGFAQPAWRRAALKLYAVKVGRGSSMLVDPVIVAGFNADDARATMQELIDHDLRVKHVSCCIRDTPPGSLECDTRLDTIVSVRPMRTGKRVKLDAEEKRVQSLLDHMWRITGVLWSLVQVSGEDLCDPFKVPLPGGPAPMWDLRAEHTVFPLNDLEGMFGFCDFTNGGIRKFEFAERYEVVEAHLEAWYVYKAELKAEKGTV
jgi:hypothetical protein